MKELSRIRFLASVVALCVATLATAAVPQLISVQGQLTDNTGSVVADADYLLTFTIYDAPAGGSNLWTSADQVVSVVGGVFVYQLGSDVPLPNDLFATDTVRYLGIVVGGDPEISPRTRLTSGSYVYQALRSDTAAYALAAPGGGGGGGWTDDGDVVRLETTSDSVGIGTTTPSAKLEVVGDAIITGKATIGPDNVNTGHNAFVAGQLNSVSSMYATVSGGLFNEATAAYSTVGGGQYDTAGGAHSVVAGGQRNTASGNTATIGGGNSNTAIGSWSVIAGGTQNMASGSMSSVGGGRTNNATGPGATIAGGQNNQATGDTSTVGGGFVNQAIGAYSFVGGGDHNRASGNHSSVAGGKDNIALSSKATVGGGSDNVASNSWATVSGGLSNVASEGISTVGGGQHNDAIGWASTVAGGSLNSASGSQSVVSGGGGDQPADSNIASGDFSVIGGGKGNRVSGAGSNVSGGVSNIVWGSYSSISGGFADTIAGAASYSYLFGVGSYLSQDSTFMVDMPHVRFGDEATGYEFPTFDGSAGQVMATDGSGQLGWSDGSGMSQSEADPLYVNVTGDTMSGDLNFDTNDDGVPEAQFVLQADNVDFYLKQAGQMKVALEVNNGGGGYGSLDLHDENGHPTARLNANEASGGSLALKKENGDNGITLNGGSTTVGSYLALRNAGGLTTIEMNADLTGNSAVTLPDNSIGSDEILDNTITSFDIATNAVGADEIFPNSVGSAEIASNAVGADELDINSVSSDKIIDGSIALIDLSDAVVPAIGITTLSGSTASTTPATIDQFTVTVPGTGFLQLSVSGQFYFNLDAPPNTTWTDWGALGLCGSPGTDCGNSYRTIYYQDAEDAVSDGTSHTEFFYLQLSVAVASGSYTFYLNGQATSTHGAQLFIWGNAIATALYVPAAISVSSPVAANDNQTEQQP